MSKERREKSLLVKVKKKETETGRYSDDQEHDWDDEKLFFFFLFFCGSDEREKWWEKLASGSFHIERGKLTIFVQSSDPLKFLG